MEPVECAAVAGIDKSSKATISRYKSSFLTVVVIGASGDLAKKKTYPALFDLYLDELLPPNFLIMGYARSAKSTEEFRIVIRTALMKSSRQTPETLDTFLSHCMYCSGQYDSRSDFVEMTSVVVAKEREHETSASSAASDASGRSSANRLFYFAIPPNVFVATARSIDASGVTGTSCGWSRIVVEKPFGRDLDSSNRLQQDLAVIFDESSIYRIDHYLGKEIVQNMIMFRFSNIFIEPVLSAKYVHSVQITFKEPFGVEGRAGYFDSYGIIRDIIQNHLVQLLSLVAMEPPVVATGEDSAELVRNAKVNLLRCISPPSVAMGDCIVGQYAGYSSDPDVDAASKTPTFALVKLHINNARWEGVPFILKAGKAMDSHKAEIRVQFKDQPGASFMFPGFNFARNELVIKLQPEAIYLKMNVKRPGLGMESATSELNLSYRSRFDDASAIPDAYPRLLLEVLRGDQSTFVRKDELSESWRIFTPLLRELEQHSAPIVYEKGSRGPAEADSLLYSKLGIKRDETYAWKTT